MSLDVLATTDGHVRVDGSPGRSRPRTPRRRIALLALAAVLVTAGGVFALLRTDGGGGGAPEAASAQKATSTAEVTRQDLVARTEVDGTLGYSGELSVLNGLPGTITSLPTVGTVVERGQALFSVDNRPVPLLYGELPMWRRLALGMTDGPDVKQLEQNLVALGHATEAELLVDEKFTSATAAAVKKWQAALGVNQTGSVEVGEAVFLPEAIRVSAVRGERGGSAPPGQPLLTGTTTNRVVSVDLDATKQALAKTGEKVDVRLPSGRSTTGTIASVGTVAQTRGQGETARRVVTLTVTLDDPSATGTVDQAPVKVGITSDSRKGVLAVPVNALLALSEGGYGVRLASDGRIVAVETGLFARGMVEVRSDELSEGVEVEVPAS